MVNLTRQSFLYNPHLHVKIWFSNQPDVFMNDENQMRLREMRYKNPSDTIRLVYDSSLLEALSVEALHQFCKEQSIIPIDANALGHLLKTTSEKKLYAYYQDEINHLDEGGNLAVASDIIRWLSPVYQCGTYTDLDVPIDTSKLPPLILVNTPLLMNIGSLKIRNREFILTNNDYIAIVNPGAAKRIIRKIHQGLIETLKAYTNDFLEKTEQEILGKSYIHDCLLNCMKNRAESVYIAKSKSVFPKTHAISSRKLRNHISKIMTDEKKFIDFNRSSRKEPDECVIKKLRTNLKNQLRWVRWLFFRHEYNEINTILSLPDHELIAKLMKKEHSLYLKSIVICTTGPIAIAKSLFNGYVFKSDFFHHIEPYSFHTYRLQRAFISKNSLKFHENILSMVRLLGAREGTLNDSSWLEEGARLQASRSAILQQKKRMLNSLLPNLLAQLKIEMESYVSSLLKKSNGLVGFLIKQRRKTKIQTLLNILACFKESPEKELDLLELRQVLEGILNEKPLFPGLWYSRTHRLIQGLEHYAHDAIVLNLAKNNKIMWGEPLEHSSLQINLDGAGVPIQVI